MTEPSESAKTTAIETDTPSTEDKNIKDANAVNSVENAEKTESTTHTGRGKAIAIAAVVLILIAGVGGYAYWKHFEAAAYHDSVVTAETADTKLTKTIDKATAVTYKADQLKSPSCWTSSTTPSRRRRVSEVFPTPSRMSGWHGSSLRRRTPTPRTLTKPTPKPRRWTTP